MEQRCRLCGSPRQAETRRCECGYVYPPPPQPGFYSADDPDLPAGDPYPVVFVVPRGPLTLILSLMMLVITGTNGPGACLMLMSIMLAAFVGQLLGVGAWGYLLAFGVLAIVVDAVGRRLQRCPLFDVRRGSQFMLSPVWALGVLGLVAGAVTFVAVHS